MARRKAAAPKTPEPAPAASPPPASPPPAPKLEEEFHGAELELIQWYALPYEDRPLPKVKIGRRITLERLSQAEIIRYLRLVRLGGSYQQVAMSMGVSREQFIVWRRNGLKKKWPLLALFLKATRQAEAFAVMGREIEVAVDNPKEWLARRARSFPGYLGWEPEPQRHQFEGGDSPIELRHTQEIADVRAEEDKRLLSAIKVLRSLGLANEQNLLGHAAGDEEDDDE